MPKDKTESHQKIIDTAKKLFLEKGFEKVSIREIAKAVGIVQGGIYKHFKSKEDIFNSLIDPFVEVVTSKFRKHQDDAYMNFANNKESEAFITDNNVVMIKDLITNYHDELRLIVCCSHGTKYQNFIDDLIWMETKETYKAFIYLKEHGVNVKDYTEEELHVLITSYIYACLEPIEHDWSIEKSIKCLEKLEEFFIPAWKSIMGF